MSLALRLDPALAHLVMSGQLKTISATVAPPAHCLGQRLTIVAAGEPALVSELASLGFTFPEHRSGPAYGYWRAPKKPRRPPIEWRLKNNVRTWKSAKTAISTLCWADLQSGVLGTVLLDGWLRVRSPNEVLSQRRHGTEASFRSVKWERPPISWIVTLPSSSRPAEPPNTFLEIHAKVSHTA